MKSESAIKQVFSKIDQLNRQDPSQVLFQQAQQPAAFVYGVRMTERLSQFEPNASEVLQIACRAQHIQRFKIQRDQYPMDKLGYKKWRSDLGAMHASITSELMAEAGYCSEDCQRVEKILRKQQLKSDNDTQILEDVACLVFLEHYFSDFCDKHNDEKLVGILQKTWKKMSADGQSCALNLSFGEREMSLIQRALG